MIIQLLLKNGDSPVGAWPDRGRAVREDTMRGGASGRLGVVVVRRGRPRRPSTTTCCDGSDGRGSIGTGSIIVPPRV